MTALTACQLFPHVKHVMDKYRSKLPKDDLKRFAKEVSKKLVASDFKNKRVEDPTHISSKQERQVKKYVKEFFEKAVAKKGEHDRRKAEKTSTTSTAVTAIAVTPAPAPALSSVPTPEDVVVSDDDDVKDENDDSPESDLKRKRELDETPPTDPSPVEGDADTSIPLKRGRYDATHRHLHHLRHRRRCRNSIA